MSVLVLWTASAAAAAFVSWRASRHLVRVAPLTRTNYRGLEVPTAVGAAVLVGFLAGVAVVTLGRVLFTASGRLEASSAEAVPFVAAALGFGLLGLWDDLVGGSEHGWRAHLGALARGRATGGAVKLFGGAALALVVVAPRGEGTGWAFANAAIVALSANIVNLLDVRPGRALKGAGLAIIGLLVFGGAPGPALAAAFGAGAAFAPLDLRERAMLGDAGANGLGAIVGCGVVAVGSDAARLGALAILLVLHALADRPGLSRGIDAVPPLRALDRAGRAPG